VSFQVEVPIEELRKRTLFLATPCYGGICTMTFMRSVADLTALAAQMQIKVQLYMLSNESLITRARAYCADEFLRSEAANLLFIDSDICFNPHDIIAMFAAQTEESEYDVIGAPYPKKCISWEKIKMAVDKGFADEDPNHLDKYVGDFVFNPVGGKPGFAINAPVEVLETGTGYMMIKRSVFDKFKAAYPEYAYRPDHVRSEHFDGTRLIHMYFQAEIDRFDFERHYFKALHKIKFMDDPDAIRSYIEDMFKEAEEGAKKKSLRYLSEDYFFCQKVQGMGCKVWLFPWMKSQHYGSFNFGGSLIDLAQLGANPTADAGHLLDIRKKQKEKEAKKVA
jgi:hypothetical protein